MNIIKKLWLHKVKKQIIEKYNQKACNMSKSLFMKEYRICEQDMFNIHANLVSILRDIDENMDKSGWYLQSLQKLNTYLEEVKERFVILFKQYRHQVRMYHWMYMHGYHNKYAQVFGDGQTFKSCYEDKIEKYEMEFKPFDISLELKKCKIKKRKRELENDFNS